MAKFAGGVTPRMAAPRSARTAGEGCSYRRVLCAHRKDRDGGRLRVSGCCYAKAALVMTLCDEREPARPVVRWAGCKSKGERRNASPTSQATVYLAHEGGASARWPLLGRTSENTPSTHSGEYGQE